VIEVPAAPEWVTVWEWVSVTALMSLVTRAHRSLCSERALARWASRLPRRRSLKSACRQRLTTQPPNKSIHCLVGTTHELEQRACQQE